MTLRAKIIKVGNSKGITIPKEVLEKLDLDVDETIEVDLKKTEMISLETEKEKNKKYITKIIKEQRWIENYNSGKFTAVELAEDLGITLELAEETLEEEKQLSLPEYLARYVIPWERKEVIEEILRESLNHKRREE